MSDCVFCQIIDGRVPRSVVYEDDAVLAFLDLFPVHPGHTLVVPRAHVVGLDSCPLPVAGRLFTVSARLAPTIVHVTGAQGFNVWTANGSAAGQQVFHLHLHILPRFRRDGLGLRFPRSYPTEAPRARLDAMAETIRSVLRK